MIVVTDGRLSVKDVRRLLKSRADQAGGARALARAWMLSNVYISAVINGDKPPGESILRKLGLREVTYYEPRASSTDQPAE